MSKDAGPSTDDFPSGSALLPELLRAAAEAFPSHEAIREVNSCASIAYVGLLQLARDLCDSLRTLGVGRGDRVGIYLGKSIDAVASIFGILQSGAAYVPIDSSAPASRNAKILADCSVRVLILEERFEPVVIEELQRLDCKTHRITLPTVGGGAGLREALRRLALPSPPPADDLSAITPDDLAYILYTSGSTGVPKGVMLSHRNATSFVHWCSHTFLPTERDRFSSHAPLHFDLSIFDLFVSIKHGATLVLIDEATGKSPGLLAAAMAHERISIWYSTPSILGLLTQYGKLEQHNLSSLRIVLFAGETFPIPHLRALKQKLPGATCFNLYGPTETNVCTWYEIPRHIPDELSAPYPIGTVCRHMRAKVVDVLGNPVAPGEVGELCIDGQGVMMGYWNAPFLTAEAFLADQAEGRWYRTGDQVVELAAGGYDFLGRRDRMVKKRGYRVELGEIETCLYRHPRIQEAAVLAVSDEKISICIVAVLSPRNRETLSSIELKRFCAEHLPAYMVPDRFHVQDQLPKTSTDKIDYRKLASMTDSTQTRNPDPGHLRIRTGE